MTKRISAAFGAIALMLCLAVAAQAAVLPDLSQNGSISIRMEKDRELLDSGKIAICRVGDIVVEDWNFSFALIDALKEEDISLKDPTDPRIAEALAKAAKEKKLPRTYADIRKGDAKFTDVVPGLYLVLQEEADASRGYYPIAPYLLSVPRYENGAYIQDVDAAPKVPIETAPTEPTKPTDPSLPQTGQTNWPVPMLSVSGLVLITFGWFLRYGKQKERHES